MFQVRCDYRYVNGVGIVLVYFLNGMPFVYDDITETEREDHYAKACAEAEPTLNIEHLFLNSEQRSQPEPLPGPPGPPPGALPGPPGAPPRPLLGGF